MEKFRKPVPILSPEELADAADIIVEIAPKAAFYSIAYPALKAGRLLVTVSGAGLLEHPEIIELARRGTGRIELATGALLGLDAVRAAAEGNIREVRMVTKKPPRSLVGAPYLDEYGIDVMALPWDDETKKN